MVLLDMNTLPIRTIYRRYALSRTYYELSTYTLFFIYLLIQIIHKLLSIFHIKILNWTVFRLEEMIEKLIKKENTKI